MQILTEDIFTNSSLTYAPLKFELHFDKIMSPLLFRNVLKSVEQFKDMHVGSTGDSNWL